MGLRRREKAVNGMDVAELIAMLEKVNTETANVFVNDSRLIKNQVDYVMVEHDLRDDEISVVIKTVE